MAESAGFLGGMVLSMMACLFGLSIQLSFASRSAPEPSRNSRVGSASFPARVNDGPIARTMTFLFWLPVTIKPAIKTLSPVPTGNRVEMLASTVSVPGVAVGVAVGVGGGVGVGDGVGFGVGGGVGDGTRNVT